MRAEISSADVHLARKSPEKDKGERRLARPDSQFPCMTARVLPGLDALDPEAVRTPKAASTSLIQQKYHNQRRSQRAVSKRHTRSNEWPRPARPASVTVDACVSPLLERPTKLTETPRVTHSRFLEVDDYQTEVGLGELESEKVPKPKVGLDELESEKVPIQQWSPRA